MRGFAFSCRRGVFSSGEFYTKTQKIEPFCPTLSAELLHILPVGAILFGCEKNFLEFFKIFSKFCPHFVVLMCCILYNERIKQSVTGRQLIHQCLRVGGAVSLFPASPPAPGFITSHFAKQNVRSVRSVPERSQTLGHTRNTETNRLRTHRGTFRSLITDLGSIC